MTLRVQGRLFHGVCSLPCTYMVRGGFLQNLVSIQLGLPPLRTVDDWGVRSRGE
jgi:hypothetical protein